MGTRAPLPYPLLLADAGGTNLRLAMQEESSAPLEIIARLRTADFPSFVAAARHGLGHARLQPRAAAICGAGPVVAGLIQLTNGPWLLDPHEVQAALGITACVLLNDLEALAYALPRLAASDLEPIGPQPSATAARHGTRLVIGVGTGLGAAALVEHAGGMLAIATEAGMMDLAPVGADEMSLWPYVERIAGRVPVEGLLSGPGLARLDAAIRKRDGLCKSGRSPEMIVASARAGGDPAAAEAVERFIRLLARVSGDLALAFKATGGVHLAGGMVAGLAGLIDGAAFRTAFEAKTLLGDLMATIPTLLIRSDTAALLGLAAYAG